MNRLSALLLCSLFISACTGADPVPGDSGSTSPNPTTSESTAATSTSSNVTTAYEPIKDEAVPREFIPHSSCDALLDDLKAKGEQHVTANGLPGIFQMPIALEASSDISASFSGKDGAVGANSDTSVAAEVGGADHSTTNTQESGVGEFTQHVTNGKVIASVFYGDKSDLDSQGTQVLLIDPATLDTLGTYTLSGDLRTSPVSITFIDDNTLAILVDGTKADAQRTSLIRLDVSDPKAPKATSTLRISGALKGARIVDKKVVLATLSHPAGLPFTSTNDRSVRAERAALEKNRQVIKDSTIEQWLPDAEITDESNKPVGEPITLTDCEKVWVSKQPDFDFNTVSSVDLTEPILSVNKGASAIGWFDEVYASKDRMVGWTSQYRVERSSSSHLISFDISNPKDITVKATGAVMGHVPTAWGVDEEAGIYRVASTTAKGNKTSSRVTMLQEQDGKLIPIGRLDGLGKDEEIKSIRWLSKTLGVMVTFRQTDPVYTIDTTDPTKPKTAGELKIPGYSAYLHPVGETKLLGMGQQADPGTGRPLGFKYSLFDISDLANPKEIDVREFSGASSGVEYDHQGFTWHKGRGYTVINDYSRNMDEEGNFNRIIHGVKIEHDKIVELGRGDLSDIGGMNNAQTLVIGEHLYGLSNSSIGKYGAETIKEEKQRSLLDN